MSLAKTMFRAVRNCLSRKCWKLLFVLNFRFLTIYKNRFWNYSYKIDIENILYESLKFMINLLRIEMQFLILFSKVNEDKCEETKPISIAHMHTDNGRYTRLKYLILWSIVHHLEKKFIVLQTHWMWNRRLHVLKYLAFWEIITLYDIECFLYMHHISQNLNDIFLGYLKSIYGTTCNIIFIFFAKVKCNVISNIQFFKYIFLWFERKPENFIDKLILSCYLYPFTKMHITRR